MFVIVRHGNTFEAGEDPRRIGARTDLPLTAHGFAQADALGRHFSNKRWQFARVLVSPLQRTQQTAQAILKIQTSAPVPEPAEFLREIDHGPDENMSESAVLGRIGTQALSAWEDSAIPPPGWVVGADERIDAWRDLFDNGQDAVGPVLLVTSNGAARFALLADPTIREEAQKLPSLKLPTGGYGTIARDDAGQLSLIAWGVRP
ncbi:histidine phosphatase family protein [Qipengyuania qiaonensis]|uniref:Histidine phosphatase family protein n=1 Tax=Qipengyuania qiaonensis TaxID=2867240 RepID=A0ABS7J7Y1_9SPHN|nr:histidine phosphatase family protein [Qipengyuania qiaonensis]MBX7481994.1 histidine phosphatase family protein [Qipengyuania qiaonensis]